MPDEAALMSAARESAATAGAFGADLYPLLAQDGANTVFSPLSVASALWMAWCGARGRDGAYRRSLRLPHGPGIAALRPGSEHIGCQLALTDLRDLSIAISRCRRLLDLDADPVAVDDLLRGDPVLAPLVAKAP